MFVLYDWFGVKTQVIFRLNDVRMFYRTSVLRVERITNDTAVGRRKKIIMIKSQTNIVMTFKFHHLKVLNVMIKTHFLLLKLMLLPSPPLDYYYS